MIQPFFKRIGRNLGKNVVGIFVQTMTPKGHFEINWPLPGAGRTRGWHHHGSHTTTSPGAILLGKMAYHTKQIRRQCIILFCICTIVGVSPHYISQFYLGLTIWEFKSEKNHKILTFDVSNGDSIDHKNARIFVQIFFSNLIFQKAPKSRQI